MVTSKEAIDINKDKNSKNNRHFNIIIIVAKEILKSLLWHVSGLERNVSRNIKAIEKTIIVLRKGSDVSSFEITFYS